MNNFITLTKTTVKGFNEYKPKLLFAEVDMHQRYHGADNFEKTNSILIKLGYKLIYKQDVNSFFTLKELC